METNQAASLPAEVNTSQVSSADTTIVIPNYVEETPGKVDPHDILYGATPVFPTGHGFYIWYKESMPSDVDTSVISDEYELLYQSVKITEYKSRLNLYVTAYSICLAAIIFLMLMSPFLTEPVSFLSNREIISGANNSELYQKAENKLSDEIVLGGITKNSVGFTDLIHNVVYVQLPNGGFAIQESSWSSEENAKERVKMLNTLGIKDANEEKITAQLLKVDLGEKGIRYRAMFGEFASIEQAQQIAEEIKSTGKPKNLSYVSNPNGAL